MPASNRSQPVLSRSSLCLLLVVVAWYVGLASTRARAQTPEETGLAITEGAWAREADRAVAPAP